MRFRGISVVTVKPGAANIGHTPPGGGSSAGRRPGRSFLRPHEGQARQDDQKHHQIPPPQPESGQSPRLPRLQQLAAPQVVHQEQDEAHQGQKLSGLQVMQWTPLSSENYETCITGVLLTGTGSGDLRAPRGWRLRGQAGWEAAPKMAEREGFEPSVEVSPHTRLAGEHLRPARSSLRKGQT